MVNSFRFQGPQPRQASDLDEALNARHLNAANRLANSNPGDGEDQFSRQDEVGPFNSEEEAKELSARTF